MKNNYSTLLVIFSVFSLLSSCSSNTTEKNEPIGKYYSLNQRDNNFQSKIFLVSIENDTKYEIKLEQDPREIEQLAKADIELSISYDSSNNSVISTTYRDIKFSKNDGKEEIRYDATEGTSQLDPTSRIIGMLRNASITSIVSPSGEILAVNGLKELGDSVMLMVSTPDINSKQQLRQQWDNLIQEGMVNKNTRQLFGVIPDSAVRIGDSWTKQYEETGEINFNVSVTYVLEKYTEGIAYISSSGMINSNNNAKNMLQPSSKTNLHGKLKGRYEVDVASGLVLKSNVETSAQGIMAVMGKSIPIEIKNTSILNSKIISMK